MFIYRNNESEVQMHVYTTQNVVNNSQAALFAGISKYIVVKWKWNQVDISILDNLPGQRSEHTKKVNLCHSPIKGMI